MIIMVIVIIIYHIVNDGMGKFIPPINMMIYMIIVILIIVIMTIVI